MVSRHAFESFLMSLAANQRTRQPQMISAFCRNQSRRKSPRCFPWCLKPSASNAMRPRARPHRAGSADLARRPRTRSPRWTIAPQPHPRADRGASAPSAPAVWTTHSGPCSVARLRRPVRAARGFLAATQAGPQTRCAMHRDRGHEAIRNVGTLAGIDNLLVLLANVRYVAHVLFFVAFATLPGICSR